MATLQHIADMTGVSKATVSRVINNHPTVSPEIKKKVLDAIQTLKLDARALKRSQENSKMIGVILPFSSSISKNSFSLDILTGAEEKALERDYMILFGSSRGTIEKERELAFSMMNREVEGLIVLSVSKPDNADHLAGFNAKAVPIVCVDQKIEGVQSHVVRGDNVYGATSLAEHLYALGHRTFGIVAPHSLYSTFRERVAAFRAFLQEKGLDFAEAHSATVSFGDSLEPIRKLLTAEPRPTALFLPDPMLLMPVMQAVQSLGLSVPKDISIAVFDDDYTDLPDVYRNYFTSVSQSGKMLGRLAIELLFQSIQNPETGLQNIVVSGETKFLQSTAAPPA